MSTRVVDDQGIARHHLEVAKAQPVGELALTFIQSANTRALLAINDTLIDILEELRRRP